MAWDPNDPAPPWLAPQQPPVDPYGSPDPYAMPPAPGQALADPWAIPPPAAPPPDAIPPPPQVDATTSPDAGISPHEQYLNNVEDVSVDKPNQTPTEDAQTRAADFAKFAPQDQADIVANGDPQKLAQMATDKMDPQQLADIALRHEQARLHQQAADMLTTSRDNEAKAAAQYKEWMDAQAKAHADTVALNVDAQRLAATKIDSRPDVVTAIIGIVMSGLYAGMSKQGSPNLALQSFSKAIDMAAQDQRDNLANAWKGIDTKRNAIAEEVKYHGDVYRASTAFRVAAYDSAMQNVQTQAQNYDPQGTTAIQFAQLNQGLAAQRALAMQAYTDKQLKNHLEQQKADNETATLQQTVKHQNDETAIARGHLGIDYSKNSRDQKEFDLENAPITPEQARLENPGLPDAAYPKANVTRKVLKATIESYQKGLEAQGKANENAQKQAGGQVLDGTGNPYLKDGKPVQVDPEVAKDLNKEIGGGQGYIDEMSKVKRMLAADPSTFDRDKWAELNSHLETAAAQWTKLYGAKASSRELEAAKEVVGANYEGYASRVKDKGTGIAAIGAQIDSTKRNLNTELKRRAGITGGADLIDTSEPPPTKETPEDKFTKVLSTNYGKVDPVELDADDRAFQQITKGTDLNTKITTGLVNDHFSPVVNRALQTGVAPSQQRALDQLQAAIRGADDVARAKALDVLGGLTGANKDQSGNKASATGANANVRAAAQAIMDEAFSSAMPASTETIGPEVR